MAAPSHFGCRKGENLTAERTRKERYQIRRAMGGDAVKLGRKAKLLSFSGLHEDKFGTPWTEPGRAKIFTNCLNRNTPVNVSKTMSSISESEAGPGPSH